MFIQFVPRIHKNKIPTQQKFKENELNKVEIYSPLWEKKPGIK